MCSQNRLLIAVTLLLSTDGVSACFAVATTGNVKISNCNSCSSDLPILLSTQPDGQDALPISETSAAKNANGCLTKSIVCPGSSSNNLIYVNEYNTDCNEFNTGATDTCTITLTCQDDGQWGTISGTTNTLIEPVNSVYCMSGTSAG